MSFESGSIGCRFFDLPRDLPENFVARFAKHTVPPLDKVGTGRVAGWVGGRHLLDRQITEASIMCGGFLRLSLLIAERKIPATLLRAECRMEELARMAADGKEFLNARVRREIREQVAARLLPQMPPTLKAIHLAADPRRRVLAADAMSDASVDFFGECFRQAVDLPLLPLTPAQVALMHAQADVRQWPACSFSPDVDDALVSDDAGLDFLTWLWFHSEARGGILRLPKLGEWGLLVEGPLTFVMEGEGAHVVVLRNGQPTKSAEAAAALRAGKKLRSARVTLARGEEQWSCTLDASAFIFRGLKLPPGEKLDAVSRFQERMERLCFFREAFIAAFSVFAAERHDARRWEQTLTAAREWVAGKAKR